MGETQEEHDRKREYNYMTCSILKDRKMHMLASLHFNYRGNRVFMASAILTLIQTGLAILAQADLKSFEEDEDKWEKKWEDHQNNITVSIAFLAAFSVFWQSLVKNWNYNGRASLHDSAAAALGKLYKTSELRRRQEKALKNNGSSGGAASKAQSSQGQDKESLEKASQSNDAASTLAPADDDGDGDTNSDEENQDFMNSNLFDQLVKQYEQALEGCTSFIPPGIVAAFELLDNQIGVCKRKIDTGLDTEHKVRVEWEKVYPTLYRELYATIITQHSWPLRVPNPKYVVEETLKRFKTKLKPELLDILIERNSEIEQKYKKVEEV